MTKLTIELKVFCIILLINLIGGNIYAQFAVNDPTLMNLPAGFTIIYDDNFTNLSGITIPAGQGETNTSISSQTTPNGDGKAVDDHFPQGFPGGESPTRYKYGGNFVKNSGSLYICKWIKMSSNWTHANVLTKQDFWRQEDASGNSPMNDYWGLYGEFTNKSRICVSQQSHASSMYVTLDTLYPNIWYKVELLLTANTPGIANGRLQCWLNNKEVRWENHSIPEPITNIKWFADTGVARFDYLWHDPTYGGGLKPVPNDMDIFTDRMVIAVSGKVEFLGTDEFKKSNSNFPNSIVYPVPANDKINIETKDYENSVVSIFDINGSLVFKQKLNKSIEEINVSSLPHGIYYIKITSANREESLKVVLQ